MHYNYINNTFFFTVSNYLSHVSQMSKANDMLYILV